MKATVRREEYAPTENSKVMGIFSPKQLSHFAVRRNFTPKANITVQPPHGDCTMGDREAVEGAGGHKSRNKTLRRANMESAPTENGGRSKPLPYHGARCFDGG